MVQTKIIVTNRGALKHKYSNQFPAIEKALIEHIGIDKERHIETSIVYMDDASFWGSNAITNPQNQEENKRSIDFVYEYYNPDYLLILGAPDIVPHQELINIASKSDRDQCVPSDLPYACSKHYSENIEDFRAPTRKVGRLPDIIDGAGVGKKDPTYLIKLLTNKNRYKKYPHSNYLDYFSLSTDTWKESTCLSARRLFDNDQGVEISPPNDENIWKKQQLQKYTHFINCHGGPKHHHYYGESLGEKKLLPSLSAQLIKGCIVEGNIAAVECCYGAQLYDPDSLPHAGPSDDFLGMCNRYLAEGCVAFFGSSTIAYGPASGNSSADLITQYFIQNMLEGLSAGAACLKARQDFVTNVGLKSPIGQKTLAQFNLMGDPSAQPVELLNPHGFEEFLSLQSVSQIEKRNFENKAKYIEENIGWSTQESSVPSTAASEVISKIIETEGIEESTLYTFTVQYPKSLDGNEERLAFPEHVYLLMHQKKLNHPIDTQIIAYTIKELNGQVYDVIKEESKGYAV
jgi:hypothetical protein